MHVKKAVLGLVDFAVMLINSALNLPNEQVKFFGKFKLHKNCICNQCSSAYFFSS